MIKPTIEFITVSERRNLQRLFDPYGGTNAKRLLTRILDNQIQN